MRSTPHLTVGEIVRRYGTAFLEAYGDSISYRQKKILLNLSACQTPSLGGHVYRCDSCGQLVGIYKSCCDRHCPSCQAREAAAWTTARLNEILPVLYFHIVFTLPHEWCPLILQNRVLFYNLLFRAASQALLTLAADPAHLGAHIGFMMVLHTWSQTLLFHPHVHCVAPGGGISADGTEWIRSKDGFFLPVRVVGARFRTNFLSLVREAFDAGQIQFHGEVSHWKDPLIFDELLNVVQAKNWGVHTKKPFDTPDQVVKYLARYTHRIAISNSRIVSIEDGQVTFLWEDRANGNQKRLMTLPAIEFLRRFLLHVLPKGFVRIRYYGLHANRHRAENLARCLELIAESGTSAPPAMPDLDTTSGPDSLVQADDDSMYRCPFCKAGHLVYVRDLEPNERVPLPSLPPPTATDSS